MLSLDWVNQSVGAVMDILNDKNVLKKICHDKMGPEEDDYLQEFFKNSFEDFCDCNFAIL